MKSMIHDEVEIKERIRKGAEELFVRYSVKSVTMDDIAHHLGISKKTLYQHFNDKDDIVTSATRHHIRLRGEEFDLIRAKAQDAVEELVLMSAMMIEQIRSANPSMLYDLQKYHAHAWSLWMEHRNGRLRQFIIDNLRMGMEQGYYREGINPDIIATIRLETIQMGFDPSIFPTETYTTSSIQLELLNHYTFAILTDKGRRKFAKYVKTVFGDTESLKRAFNN